MKKLPNYKKKLDDETKSQRETKEYDKAAIKKRNRNLGHSLAIK